MAAAAERYYSGKFAVHGPTARGVDWNSEESQRLRFQQLLRVVSRPQEQFSILDYGCGYGALVDHLQSEGFNARYVGYDLSRPMIEYARSSHPGDAQFVTDETELEPYDYAVASGLMNVRQAETDSDWHQYCLHVIGRLTSLSTSGFAFNMLTSYSDPERKRPDLYYADPLVYFDHCKRNISRHVALLHDYGLYEFTMIVRKDKA
jgi:SAM-dependent methyltransferase